MLDKFWEGIGSNLAERWLEHIFGPAFLFWSGGVGLYTWNRGFDKVMADAQALTLIQQGTWIFLGLLTLVFSSMLMNAIRFPILRLLEGYWPWPFNYLGLGITYFRKLIFQKKYDDLRSLKTTETERKLDRKEKEKLTRLEVWVHWNPVKASELMPTTLGNILRARERSPKRKYGFDAVICWPRIWPLLPENVRNDLIASRSSLDQLIELWFWGLLFLLWSTQSPWAVVIGLLWMFLSYGISLQAAMAYGDLLESAFDLHRLSLYDAIGWNRPKNSDEEKELGAQLTEFLWRGTLPEPQAYIRKKE